MNYDKNNCIVFLCENDLITFFKNKILENEIKETTFIDLITNTKGNLLRNVVCSLQYCVDIYILKHLIISTGNLNELHVLLLWKTVSNYGIIDDNIDEDNFIFKKSY